MDPPYLDLIADMSFIRELFRPSFQHEFAVSDFDRFASLIDDLNKELNSREGWPWWSYSFDPEGNDYHVGRSGDRFVVATRFDAFKEVFYAFFVIVALIFIVIGFAFFFVIDGHSFMRDVFLLTGCLGGIIVYGFRAIIGNTCLGLARHRVKKFLTARNMSMTN